MENGEEFPLRPSASIALTHNDGQPGQQQYLAGKAPSSSHKRSISGSLLSKLSFLRMSQTSEELPLPSRTLEVTRGAHASCDDEHNGLGVGASRAGGSGRAIATTMQHQRRMRRRKGSLRKTALLGTRLDTRERRNSTSSARDQNIYAKIENAGGTSSSSPLSSSSIATSPADEEETPRGSMDRGSNILSSSSSSSSYSAYWPQSSRMDQASTNTAADLSKSTGLLGNATEDEDNLPPFGHSNRNTGNSNNNTNHNIKDESTAHHRPCSASSSSSGIPPLIGASTAPSSSSDSYFLPHRPAVTAAAADSATTHQQSPRPPFHRARSPLVTHSSIEMAANHHVDVGWDYSETEWWGWIILIVTWLVFVIGIGSSFGVWSWAWDVGETPYAPPELEDDPTLPIVGYYPALMVLTAVMAWVWVVVAWVGMKYFKHANISADDG